MTGRPAAHLLTTAAHAVLCCFLPLFLAACQPGGTSPFRASTPQARPRPAMDIGDMERKVHALVNRERQKHGLSPLAWDDALARIARGHSSDMGKRAYFRHDSPEGNDFTFRYREQGYTCSIRTGSTAHLGAENIASNYLYRAVTTVNGVPFYDWNTADQIADAAVRGWMNSPGHRKNILTPYWQNEGIGIIVTPDDRVIITQNFC